MSYSYINKSVKEWQLVVILGTVLVEVSKILTHVPIAIFLKHHNWVTQLDWVLQLPNNANFE